MKIHEKLWKNDEGYFLEVDVQCLEKLHELHNDLLFLPETIKTEKVRHTHDNVNNFSSSDEFDEK